MSSCVVEDSSLYACISVDVDCFRQPGTDMHDRFVDRFHLLAQIESIRGYFLHPLLDLGQTETFKNFTILSQTIRLASQAKFSCRILTSGRHFISREDTVRQFNELKNLGVSKIILRLDPEHAKSLDFGSLDNFVSASAACCMTADVIFEFNDFIPEDYFRIVRQIEQARFYTSLFFRRKAVSVRTSMDSEYPLTDLRARPYRVVIERSGNVLLRSPDRKKEVSIGDVKNRSLDEIIRPSRLGCFL